LEQTSPRWTLKMSSARAQLSFSLSLSQRECERRHKSADNDRGTSASVGSTTRYGTHKLPRRSIDRPPPWLAFESTMDLLSESESTRSHRDERRESRGGSVALFEREALFHRREVV